MDGWMDDGAVFLPSWFHGDIWAWDRPPQILRRGRAGPARPFPLFPSPALPASVILHEQRIREGLYDSYVATY